MATTSTELRERVELLLGARDPDADDVAEALTAGYGYALSLDSQRLRIERRITELAATADDPQSASELRKLWLRNRTLGAELAELRAMLRRLRDERLAGA